MNAPQPHRNPTDESLRGRLLGKYICVIALVLAASLSAFSAVEAWFSYRDHTESLLQLQQEKANAAAIQIGQFFEGIRGQAEWTIQFPWHARPVEENRIDALRLLQQAPPITDFWIADDEGREQLRVSRIELDNVGSGVDLSKDTAYVETRRKGAYFSPVAFRRESEPYMTLGFLGARQNASAAFAAINLKFVWDVVSQIKVGSGGVAYVVDERGRLVAHPEIDLVLRNSDLSALGHVSSASRADASSNGGSTMFSIDLRGRSVLAGTARIEPAGWLMIIELPVDEAYAPLYASLRRTLAILAAGLMLAIAAGYFLARRMVVPIKALEIGVAQIGSGALGYQVDIRTGDELELLSRQFNRMSTELADGKVRAERIGRFRRFLTAQLADILESSGGETLLESHRREITVVFCDLRGFTSFAESSEPEEVMSVLREYHAVLGRIIGKYEGTLERFVGDGLMVLFNDPLPCPDPNVRAARMTIEMRAQIRELSEKWRKSGYSLGFGMGIAHGFTTVGRIGFEGRFDYSAIGSVPNLASRLCGEASDGQILCDPKVQIAIDGMAETEFLGEFQLKGFRRATATYNILGLRPSE